MHLAVRLSDLEFRVQVWFAPFLEAVGDCHRQVLWHFGLPSELVAGGPSPLWSTALGVFLPLCSGFAFQVTLFATE